MPQDYSGEHLQGRSFAFHDLTGADFSGAHLQGETFWKADLSGADLSGAFRRPGISRADMEGANGLDSITGLIGLGYPGSCGVSDRPYPDYLHTRAP